MNVVLDTDTAADLAAILAQLEEFLRHASDATREELADFTGHTHNAHQHLTWLTDYLSRTTLTLTAARQAVTA